MVKKTVLGVVAVIFAAAVMAPAASANCIPAKSASTYAGGVAVYWNVATPGTLLGQFWQLGSPAGASTGSCVDFLYFSGGNKINLNLNLGDACAAGCPASGSNLAVLAQNQTATGTDFLLATVTETPAGSVNFDYTSQGDHNLIPIPRPRVTSSSRVGSNVNLNVAIDSIAAGLFGPNAGTAVVGYNILGASGTSDPGRSAGAYSLRATVPAAGGVAAAQPLVVDCSNPAADQWLVTQIRFENGSVLSGAVSEAVRVNCNPALANPKPKVKVAPKATPRATSN